jgi:hypothetical protein
MNEVDGVAIERETIVERESSEMVIGKDDGNALKLKEDAPSRTAWRALLS